MQAARGRFWPVDLTPSFPIAVGAKHLSGLRALCQTRGLLATDGIPPNSLERCPCGFGLRGFLRTFCCSMLAMSSTAVKVTVRRQGEARGLIPTWEDADTAAPRIPFPMVSGLTGSCGQSLIAHVPHLRLEGSTGGTETGDPPCFPTAWGWGQRTAKHKRRDKTRGATASCLCPQGEKPTAINTITTPQHLENPQEGVFSSFTLLCISVLQAR